MQQVIEWSSENNNKGVIRSNGLMTFLYLLKFEESHNSFYYGIEQVKKLADTKLRER